MARFRVVQASVCRTRAALHQAVYDRFGRRVCNRQTWACCMDRRPAHVAFCGVDRPLMELRREGMACSNERGTVPGDARSPWTYQPAALSSGVLAQKSAMDLEGLL